MDEAKFQLAYIVSELEKVIELTSDSKYIQEKLIKIKEML